jgi:hypothetical protein
MPLIDLFNRIKKEYCSLFSYKLHGNTIEVITPFATLTDKFVSVFITIRNDKIIVSDGGFIANNLYEVRENHEDKDIVDTLLHQYLQNHSILTTVNSNGIVYYKSTDKVELISVAVFDVCNFIVNFSNSNVLDYRDKKEKQERDKFKSFTNEYLKDIYKEKFYPNKQIVDGLRVSGAISSGKDLHILEYVTGHTNRHFSQDLRKAIINFQLVNKVSTIKPYIKSRIAIFNDQSAGFQQGIPPILENYLAEFTTRSYIKRSELDTITSIINPN